MAVKKCSRCGGKIDSKTLKCSKCKKKQSIKPKNEKFRNNFVFWIPRILYILIQGFICFLVVFLSRELLYSGDINHLFLIMGVCVAGIINALIMIRVLFLQKNKSFINILLLIITISTLGIEIIYFGKSINAVRFGNSSELVMLNEKYSLNDAKVVKKKIEEIFEYDFEEVSSRDVVIGSFYEDEDVYILYLDDSYGNYRLKFYLKMANNNIDDVYWLYDDTEFYLVKDGSKTDNFEYYYAMSVLSGTRESEIHGLATIENDVETYIKDGLDDSANAIFTYDELKYDKDTNTFYFSCHVHSMDYYGNGYDESFEVLFTRMDEVNKKKVWYYGDSSFDYVNWSVENK